MEKMKALLFFVDNNPQEIAKIWKESYLSGNNEMVPFTPFQSVEETVSLVKAYGATIVVLGFHLTDGLPTGMDVLYRLQEIEEYSAAYISNTGGNSKELFPCLEKHADRDGFALRNAVLGIKSKRFLGLGYEKNLEYFKLLLQQKKYSELLPILKRVKHYCEIERYVFSVLEEKIQNESPGVIQDVLDYFIDLREDFCPEHGYWVHSASHFNSRLWELGRIPDVQRFLKTSIRGANELSDDNCSSRLIRDFFHFSRYYDYPSDFHITFENIHFYELTEYEKARIEKGVFASEEEYLSFQLGYSDNPNLTSWSNDYQLILLDDDEVKSLVERLNNFNNSYTLDEFMNSLYKKQLVKLTKMLKVKTNDRTIERLNVALSMTKNKCT